MNRKFFAGAGKDGLEEKITNFKKNSRSRERRVTKPQHKFDASEMISSTNIDYGLAHIKKYDTSDNLKPHLPDFDYSLFGNYLFRVNIYLVNNNQALLGDIKNDKYTKK